MAQNELTDFLDVDNDNTDIHGTTIVQAQMYPFHVDNAFRNLAGMLARFTGDDTIVAATTTNLASVPGSYVSITGNTTITGFGTIKAGTIKYLKFTGTPTITYNATSMILPGALSITAAAGDTMIVVSEGSGNWRCLDYQRVSGDAVTLASGSIYGLTISNNVTDAVNDINIATGVAVDSTNVISMTLATGLIKRLDAAWAVGTNQGGRMSAAAIADTTYHMFLIRRPDTGVVDVGFDVSPTAPTLPTNYTQFRRIGSVIRLGGTILAFLQTSDLFMLETPVQDYATTALGTTAATVTLTVPTGISVGAIIAGAISFAGPAFVYVLINSILQSNLTPTNGLWTVFAGGASGQSGWFDGQIQTTTSATVRFRSNTASTGANFFTRGWVDTRGQ